MIKVNGDAVAWHEGMTVRDVLAVCNYRFPLLVVSINGDLVQPRDYDETPVSDEADVQVIHLMSGG